MEYDTTVATDPQSAADCLAHCRMLMSDDDYRLACAIIELYAKLQNLKGFEECRSAMMEAFAAPVISTDMQ